MRDIFLSDSLFKENYIQEYDDQIGKQIHNEGFTMGY